MTRAAAVVLTSILALNPALARPEQPTPADDAAQAQAPADPQIEALESLLLGRFADSRRSITVYPMQTIGAGRILVGEFINSEQPTRPEGQVFFQFLRLDGRLVLRTGRFPGGSQLAPGLWAAPMIVPEIDAGRLDISSDLPVTMDDSDSPEWFEASTDHPTPVYVDRARTLQTRMRVDKNGLSLTETGYNADGESVWTFPKEGAGAYPRVEMPPIDRRESGLVVVTLEKAPDDAAPTLEAGDTAEIAYSGWLPVGYMFDSSRAPNRTPYRTPIPGQVIGGWNQGALGMRVGERRMLLVPPDLGYGARGFQNTIPPNSWLVFEIELVSLTKAGGAQ